TDTPFRATATNSCGSIESSFFTLVPCTEPPTISSQPQSQTIVSGLRGFLTVSANNSARAHADWYEGQSGDTSRPVQLGDDGGFQTPELTRTTSYCVRVSTACGAVDSDTAPITVVPALDITSVKTKKKAKRKT